MPSTRPNESGRFYSLLLYAVLACLLLICTHGLDTLSIDWDQTLVLIMSRTPLSYIWHWAASVEMHPPYYHYLIKAASTVMDQPAFFRLISTAAFLATVALVYATGRDFISRPAGMIAALLMAASPLARGSGDMIRPHALSVLFVCGGMYFLLHWFRRRSLKHLAGFTLCNALGVMCHYMSAVLVVGFAVVVLLELLRTRTLTKATFGLFALSFAFSALPVLPFISVVLKGGALVNSNSSRIDILAPITLAYRQVLEFSLPWPALAGQPYFPAVLLLCAAALAYPFTRWCTRAPHVLRHLALAFALPGVILLILKHGYVVYRYVQPLVPFLALLLGALAARLLPGRAAPAVIAFLAALLLIPPAVHRLSGGDILDPAQCGECERQLAAAMAQRLTRTDIMGMSSDDAWNALEYFYANNVRRNYMVENSATPQDPSAGFALYGDAFFGASAQALARQLGPPTHEELIGGKRLLQWRIPRDPSPAVTSLPYRRAVSMTPGDFISKTSAWNSVQFASNFGDGVCPTRVGEPSRVSYDFSEQTGSFPQLISCRIDYEIAGKGNSLRVLARFDDEPECTAFVTAWPDPLRSAFITIPRDKAYKTLRLTVELTAMPLTPVYPGLNFSTVRLMGFSAGFHGYGEPLLAGYPRAYLQDLSQSYLRLDHGKRVPVALTVEPAPGGEAPVVAQGEGFTYATPGGDRIASMRFRLSEPVNYLAFSPRVSGVGSRVRLLLEHEGEPETPLFDLLGTGDGWTPIGADYLVRLPAPLPAGTVLRAELTGVESQLFARDGSYFHRFAR
ncbi:ArnT family glycosyltransferase [Fundidesulfovibrio agrisoli]|uniref:ArnT family glycosyltransferase n=1 Tax=Fundidesulfovibrio agrisoli TaxID=2922717 RepID=UPI001FAD9812|nr:glycosyltransferase family 39 protein [Fundidesulfovibrio agrisoli]